MRTLTALLLVVAVPALAQQQLSLVPAAGQSEVLAATQERPLRERAEPWIIAGAVTLGVALVLAVVTLGVQAAAGPTRLPTSSAPTLMQSNFACAPSCDGWVNPPPK